MPNFNLKDVEKITILSALDFNEGHRNNTAIDLGISIRTLRNKLDSWNMKDYMKNYLKFEYKISTEYEEYLRDQANQPEISPERKEYLKKRSKRTD